jgi:antitoxin ParD1/3/4
MKNATLKVSLPRTIKSFVDAEVADGKYSTPSAYICAVLREFQKKRAREKVDQLLQEGLDSGSATPMTKQDWEDIRRQGLERLARRKARRNSLSSIVP